MKRTIVFGIILIFGMLPVKSQDAFSLYSGAIKNMIYGDVAYTYRLSLDCWNDDKSGKEKTISEGVFIRKGNGVYHSSTGVTTVYDGTYLLNISHKEKTIILEKYENNYDASMISRFIDSTKMKISSKITVTQDSSYRIEFRTKNRIDYPSIAESAQLTIGKDQFIKRMHLVFDKEKAELYSRPCETATIVYTPMASVKTENLALKNYVHIKGTQASGAGKYKNYKIVSNLNLSGYESK